MSRTAITTALRTATKDLPSDAVRYDADIWPCDFCENCGTYDLKTNVGPWAYVCDKHAKTWGVALGMGLGVRLVAEEDPRARQSPAKRMNDAVAHGDFDLLEELIGDGDIAEYL